MTASMAQTCDQSLTPLASRAAYINGCRSVERFGPARHSSEAQPGRVSPDHCGGAKATRADVGPLLAL
jgi:hypothetical protein